MFATLSHARTRLGVFVCLAWSLGLVAPASAQAPVPPTPSVSLNDFWKRCRGEEEGGQTMLECGEVLLQRTQVRTQAADTAAMREAGAKMLLDGLGAQGFQIQESQPSRVDCEKCYGLAARMLVDKDPGRALITAVSRSKEQLDAFVCLDLRSGDPAPSCPKLLSHVIKSGFPASVSIRGRGIQVNFAGEGLQLPSGCTSGTGEDINCGKQGHLAWDIAPPKAPKQWQPDTLSAVMNSLKQRGVTLPKPSRVACSLGGSDTRCQRWDLVMPKQRVTIISAIAQVRGKRVGAMCTWSAAGKSQSPPAVPCGILFELKAQGSK